MPSLYVIDVDKRGTLKESVPNQYQDRARSPPRLLREWGLAKRFTVNEEEEVEL